MSEEKLIKYLSNKQKEILNTIRNMTDISELNKYSWYDLYPTLQTLRALCLIDYRGDIDYPAQLVKLIKENERID